MKFFAKVLRAVTRFAWLGFFSVLVSGCVQMMILAKGLNNEGSISSEDRRRYEERRTLVSTLFKARCLGQVMEQIDRPLEGVLILKRIDITAPGRPFVGGISGGGGYTHPDWMFFRLGLTLLEVESGIYGRPYADDGFTYFDLDSRTYSVRERSNASATVVFENIGNVEEEKLGIYGRRIKVIDNLVNEVVATRTEFFGPGPCPSSPTVSVDHTLFLSKTINPVSHGCLYKTEHIDFLGGKRSSAIQACEHTYWEAHGKPAR